MKNVCQPCGEDGKIVEAIRICMQCEESYCEVCSQFHSAQKLTRSHELQKLYQAQQTEACDSQEKTDDEKSNSEHGEEEFVEESYFIPMPSISEVVESSNKASDGEEFVEPDSTTTSLELTSLRPCTPLVVRSESTSVLLKVSPPAYFNKADSSNYILQLKNSTEDKWKRHPEQFSCSDTELSVSGLMPDSTYSFRVKLIDEDSGDESQYSKGSDFISTEKESVIPGKPFQVKVSQTSVKLRWDTKGVVLEQDDVFQLAYRSDNFEQNHWNIVEQQIQDNECVVPSLSAGTDYTFKVRVFEKASRIAQEYSECSDQIHTLENTLTPGKPEAVAISHESIELKWRLIHSPQEKDDTEYQVWYKNMNKKSKWRLYENCLCDPFFSICIEGLTPATHYVFRVRKVRVETGEESDYSPISEQIKTKEKKRVPGKPSVIQTDETNIRIQWKAVTLEENEVYEVLYKSEKENQWRVSNTGENEWNESEVNKLEYDTKYKFKCRVKNNESQENGACGEESDWIATEQYRRMIIPTVPEEINITAKSIEVGWDKPEDIKSSEYYELQYRESRPGSHWEILQKYLQHDETVTVVEYLTPETEYIFRVRVVDPADEKIENDFSCTSKPIRTLKKEDKKPGKPYCTDKQTDCVTMSWDIPENIDQKDTFLMMYREKGEEEWIQMEDPLTYTQSTIEIDGLEPDTAYRFKIVLINEENVEESYSISDVIKTDKILKVPGIPLAVRCEAHSVKLIWDPAPEFQQDDYYMVAYRETNKGSWKEFKSTNPSNNAAEIKGLKSGTKYYFKVKVVNRTSGTNGEYSDPSHDICTMESPAVKLAKQSLRISQENQHAGSSIPSRFMLPLHPMRGSRNEKVMSRKLELGSRDGSCREKTIILMGETGSGKSTLVNSLANYLLQVEYQDDVRFELVYLEKEEHSKNQAQSITEWISAYIIHPSCGSRLGYTLNIVDMPGFGDTRGIEFDERTVSQLRHLFTSTSADGLSHIDAVCFLLRAPDARLTTTQNYIFDSILSVFGKNIADNIFLMITFADTNTPEVLAAISKKEGLKSKPYFLFNNCSLYSGNDDVDDSSYFFWKKTMESFDAFFEKLGRVETKSLKLSAEVLLQRDTIENTVLQLHHQVDLALTSICTLETEIGIFKKHKDAIRDNENFEYEVEEMEFIKEDISGQSIFTTNCLCCNYTCHENCMIQEDSKKYYCVAINRLTGKCKICPASCDWNLHANVPYIIRMIPKKVKKTYAEMQERFAQAEKGKLNQEELIARIGKEISDLEDDIECKMEIIAQCNNKLKEIALNPNPLSTAEYIQLMIESEKREKKSGFRQRIQALEKCRKRVEIDKTVNGVRERIKRMRSMTDMPDLAELSIGGSLRKGVKKILGAIKKRTFPSNSK